jgi:uncharacterized protein YdbL (DUF1318 family)
MKRLLSFPTMTGLLMLAACVTINVYFPAAAAEKAADRVIDDVWGADKGAQKPSPQSRIDIGGALALIIDFAIPPAQAQGQPNLDLSSPEIKRITTSMEARHASLMPYYASGAIGFTGNGDVALRDASLVPLPSRNAAKGLVNEENADRAALYRQIAVANGQPQWEGQIRAVFAQRWVARASSGWWYQEAGGNWKQK